MKNELIEQTIHSFLDLIEKRDSYTAGHSIRVAYYSTELAKGLGLSSKEVELIYNSALLHDIGKIGIPDSILLKPGKFTIEEFKMMQEHVNIGFKTIKSIEAFSEHAYIVKDHHEKYDGSGYPEGKKGDEISLYSYILSLADSFDAMTTSRIYNKSITPKEAFEILKMQDGTHFPENFVASVKDILLNQKIDSHKEQKPENEIEQEKFAFHFKDTLTGVYSYSYLNFFLLENIKKRTHKCIYYIYVRNMTQYNKDYGWEKGDLFLKEFSSYLKEEFPKSEIFRIKGDDFLVINKEHMEFDHNVIKNYTLIDNSCLKIDIHHFDFSKLDITSVKDFERLLFEDFTGQYRGESKKEVISVLRDKNKSYEEKVMDIDLDLIIKDFELFNELIKAQDFEYKNLIVEKDNLSDKFFNLDINLQLIADFNGKILQISDSCKRMLGYESKDLVNSSFLDLVHPDDVSSTIKEMKKLNHGETVFSFDNRYKHKNGNYIDLTWAACPNDTNDLIYASAHDSTKLKEKEKILYQQSKLASMGQMLENIAHQWKQPLSLVNTIVSSLELKKKLNILEDDDFNKSIESIKLSIDHLSKTVSGFKNFYNLEDKKQEFDISETFEKVLELSASSLKYSDVKIVKNIDSYKINGIENEFIQILINIIKNSCDEFARSKNSENLIFLNSSEDNSFYEIIISDNAGGIAEENIERVFDSYFTTKGHEEGSGLGLYMSKLIVEEHIHGEISVDNMNFKYDGKSYIGASFKIRIPI